MKRNYAFSNVVVKFCEMFLRKTCKEQVIEKQNELLCVSCS